MTAGLEVSRRSALRGMLAGGSALLLPLSHVKAAPTNPQGNAWAGMKLMRRGGTGFDLQAVPGRIVVAALWGSFCTVCRQEVPALLQLQREVGKDRLGVVLVSHPLFWDQDYEAALQLGWADQAATPTQDTSYDQLAAAFALQGTSLEVPQALIFGRSTSERLSFIARKSGGGMIAGIKDQLA